MAQKHPVGTFIGTMIQIVPTVWIVATGTVPSWARITLGLWVGLYLLIVVARGIASTP